MRKFALVIIGLCVVFSFAYVIAGTEEDTSYIGVKSCKICHKSAKRGNQHGVWSNGPHAKAFETLASEESKAIAAKLNIENPQESEACLKCHTTGYGKTAGKKLTKEEGVSCEACHGAAGVYKKTHTKDLVKAVKEDGLIPVPSKDKCATCHNSGSPTYKDFNYEERVKEIVHPLKK